MTTSADLNDYGYKLLMNEFPHLYTKTMVCGVRATDLTAKAAGRLAGSTMVGSAFGSVGALIATDSLRSVLSLGRKARDDADENKLRSEDFIVGLWRATKATAKMGGELRRGDIEYHYEPGDLLYGASQSLSSYVQKNRSRFGSAAFSAIGVACGGALYGFGGMMIGNIVGGQAGTLLFERRAGQSPVEITDGELEVEPLEVEDSEEPWLMISLVDAPENTGTSEGTENPNVPSCSPAPGTGVEVDPIESSIPAPSAPIATTGTEEYLEGPDLQPAQKAICQRSYPETVQREVRKVLGFGPSNRKTWTKAS